ncbi:hypothetical protein RRG08_055599 [Elysia crispata]|uniref:Uncharacterized protein n=1 Tax=Elysia crispata TaxID=231223 RepID=A0AAE1E7T8_9GAST|nr:hypothetical protein RRG08_055599 [Elysia crispata]
MNSDIRVCFISTKVYETFRKHPHHGTYLRYQTETPSPRDIPPVPNRNTLTTGHTSGTKQKHPHHGTYLRYQTETPSPRDIPPVPNRNTLTTGNTFNEYQTETPSLRDILTQTASELIHEVYSLIHEVYSLIHEVSIAVARLIPVVNSQLSRIVGDAPNQFIQELLLMEELKQLAANVYEAFSQDPSEMPSI